MLHNVYILCILRTDDDFPVDDTLQEHNMSDIEDLHEGAGTEYDKETSDSDEEHKSGINNESTVEALVNGRYIYMACYF